MAEQIPVDQGRIREVIIPNPGAGIEILITQEARVRWRISSLLYTFVTSAAAANRIPELSFVVGGVEVVKITGRAAQTAAMTRKYMWSSAPATPYVTGSTVVMANMPIVMLFNNQTVIRTVTINIQAGDSFSDVALRVEEWIEPLA